MQKLALLMALCGAVGLACAEDLTIPLGETYDLPETTNYANVVVHGTLNIPSGLQLTATNVALGPDEGDSAVINVLGNSASSLKVTGKVTVGENGGTGKIVALTDASKADTVVLSIPTLTVSANVAAHDTGFVDVLEMGKMALPVAGKIDNISYSGWNNASSTQTARLRLRNSQIGKPQAYNKTLFAGAFQLEGYDEQSTISFYDSYGSYTLNNGKVKIKTAQQDVTFMIDGSGYTATLGANLSWEGVKDIVLKSYSAMGLAANNLLPYGPEHGIVKISSANAPLKIGNTTQRLNGLDAASGPSKANNGALRGTAHSHLIFGSEDVDGTWSGHIQATVPVEKVGVGTLTVNGAASCGTLTVSEGTLRITKAFEVETLKVVEGATVVIDGVTVTPSVGAGIYGDVVLENGGRLVAPSTVSCDEDMRTEDFASYESLTKEGAGTYIMAGPYAVAPRIHVKEGTLAFAAGGYHAKLFKFNFTGSIKAGWTDETWSAGMFYFGELGFVDADFKRVGKGLSGSAIGTDPADLPAGSAAFAADHELKLINASSASALFDAYQHTRIGVTSPLMTAEGGVTLYVRLSDSAKPVVAWDFVSAYGGLPTGWTVSASLDNGASWSLVNSQTGFAPSDGQGGNWFDGGEYSSSTLPKRFPFNSTNPDLAVAGALNLPAMTVQVDAGAVLDFSKVTDARVVNGLVLDVTQDAGVLSNATLAATGTIDLVNVAETLDNKEIAFDFADSTGVENLANWSVTCAGMPIRDLTATYDATTKKFTVSLGYIRITESGEGEALTGTVPTIVEIDPGVDYTNVVALTGSGTIMKTGAGTLVLSAPSPDFAGEIFVEEGLLKGPVSNAFGTDTVYVKCSTTATAQVRIGSTVADTTFDNDFVFEGDSSASYPALYFDTSTQKKTTVNGSVTASGYLAMTDSGKGDSQMNALVTFNGPVTAVGRTVSYPADNQVQFAGAVKAACVRAETTYPRMGRLTFKSGENEIGEIKIDYVSCSASVSGSLGGAALHLTGSNTETGRGSFSVNGDQTVAWLMQDSRTTFKNYTLSTTSGTLTLTGGTSVARCQVQLNDGSKAYLSLVVNAGNDDFVQIFSNTTWTASGDLVVSNGTLRLAGTATAAKMRSLTVEGGAFELESTSANAFEGVTSVAVGAGARLRVSSASATPFDPDADLLLGKTATELPTIELPEGAALTVKRAWLGAERLTAGAYTGEGGPETATVVPWISGAGTVTVRTGGGLLLLVR